MLLAALPQSNVLLAMALVAAIALLLGGVAVWRIVVVARRISELQDRLSETEVQLRHQLTKCRDDASSPAAKRADGR